MDGPRFVTGLQDKNELCCYKDIFESDVLADAKNEADTAFAKHARDTIVFDRKEQLIVYRNKKEVEDKIDKPVMQKRTRKQKVEVEKPAVNKNDYFE